MISDGLDKARQLWDEVSGTLDEETTPPEYLQGTEWRKAAEDMAIHQALEASLEDIPFEELDQPQILDLLHEGGIGFSEIDTDPPGTQIEIRVGMSWFRINGHLFVIPSDDKYSASEKWRTAREIEEKLRETRRQQIVDDVEEATMRPGEAETEYPTTPDEDGYPSISEKATMAATRRSFEFGHLEISDLVRDAYPDASITGYSNSGHPTHSFGGTRAVIANDAYRISSSLFVALEPEDSPHLRRVPAVVHVENRLLERLIDRRDV